MPGRSFWLPWLIALALLFLAGAFLLAHAGF